MQMTLAIIVFIVAYIFIASEKISRIAIVLAGAAAMVIIGATDADKAFYSHETGIDWNVIFLLLGMMIIVGILGETGIFQYIGIKAAKIAKGNVWKLMVLLSVITAVGAAFLDNVTMVLLMVPVTISVKLSIFVLSEDINCPWRS